MRLKGSLILAVLISLLSLAAADAVEGYPRSIVDSAGREVTIDRPLERIAVFNSETVEVIRSLKASDRIIGVGKYTKEDGTFFPEMADLPGIGSVWSPDIEAVLSLHPDAVFVYGTFQASSADEIQEAIESADPSIVVVRLDLFKPESYREEVEKLGVALGAEEEAAAYLDFYSRCSDEVAERLEGVSDDEKPEVYMESWTDFKSCGAGSGWHQKLLLAGGRNIFSDSPVEYPEVDPEEILVRDPDMVIKLCGAGNLTFGGYGEDYTAQMEALREDLVSRTGWENMRAVRSGDVYIVSNDFLGGSQYFIGVAYLAKLFHPDLFEEMDPEALHSEYITRFQGLDASLAETGTFIHPEAGPEALSGPTAEA